MQNRIRRNTVAAGLAASTALAAVAAAADWPRFRGQRLDGISDETGLLEAWPEDGPPELWRVSLGEGYSGVSVVGDRAYTLYVRGSDEVLGVFDTATGKELWSYPVGRKWRDMMGSGPRSTPTVADGVAYVLGAHGTLAAVDVATGKERWRQELAETLGSRPPTWGVSTSPLVEGGLLILDAGGSGGRSIVALDRATGELVWQAESDKAGYSTPLPLTVDGSRQVVMFTGTQVVGVDPGDGKVLWKRPWKTTYDVNAATPVFISPNRLFLASGYSTGGALFELEVDGRATHVNQLWTSPRMRNQFSSSIYYQGHIYGFDNGTLKCLDARTGEEKWAAREGFGHGSMTLADGYLYVLGDRGKLALVEATPEGYRENGTVEALRGKCWTVPTLADGRLYLRNEKELVALDVRAPGS
ncbi:MAG: PQQ-binding-like beta-propeller repeat protein [Thermoanaerobaculia bacterium]